MRYKVTYKENGKQDEQFLRFSDEKGVRDYYKRQYPTRKIIAIAVALASILLLLLASCKKDAVNTVVYDSTSYEEFNNSFTAIQTMKTIEHERDSILNSYGITVEELANSFYSK